MFSYTFIETKTNIFIKIYLKIILRSNIITNFPDIKIKPNLTVVKCYLIFNHILYFSTGKLFKSYFDLFMYL